MGRNFWVRVGGGALAIFLVGLALFTAARTAKAKASEAFTDIAGELGGTVPAALARLRDSVAISLDGAPLGRLQHLTIERAGTGEMPALLALVRLQDVGQLERLRSCDLVASSEKDLHRLRCRSEGEAGLEPIGAVAFVDQKLERPFLVADSLAAELRRGEPFHLDVDLSKDVDAQLRTGDHEVVKIKADSTGAHLVVSDHKGRKVVRMKADSTGFSLSVDSAAGK
jgi:hypothetical protein